MHSMNMDPTSPAALGAYGRRSLSRSALASPMAYAHCWPLRSFFAGSAFDTTTNPHATGETADGRHEHAPVRRLVRFTL